MTFRRYLQIKPLANTVPPPAVIFCTGLSMYPTIQPGDWVAYQPIIPDRIQPGNIVLIADKNNAGQFIVHRIMACQQGKIYTQGDGNLQRDPWALMPSDIHGAALYLQRHHKIYGLTQGAWGLWQARILIRYNRGKQRLRHYGAGYYHRVASATTYCFSRLGVQWQCRVLPVQRQTGVELQLWLNQRWIGRLPPQATDWIIKPPYRLLISKQTLAHLKHQFLHHQRPQ